MNKTLRNAILASCFTISAISTISIVKSLKHIHECDKRIEKRRAVIGELEDLYEEATKRHEMFLAAKKQFETEASAGMLSQFTYEWLQCSKEAMDDIILRMDSKLEEAKALI